MTQFITLVLMTLGSFFSTPETAILEDQNKSIIISQGGDTSSEEYTGNGGWDDE